MIPAPQAFPILADCPDCGTQIPHLCEFVAYTANLHKVDTLVICNKCNAYMEVVFSAQDYIYLEQDLAILNVN